MKRGWRTISVNDRLIFVDRYGQHRKVIVERLPPELVDSSGSLATTNKNGETARVRVSGLGDITMVTVDDLWWPNQAPEQVAAAPSSNRIGFAGDWHGRVAWAERAIAAFAVAGCRFVVHVGDFGFGMVGTPDDYIKRITCALDEADIEMVVVDGNHENHDLLNRLDREGHFGRISHRIRHARRGARWYHSGIALGALGGTTSIDRNALVPGVNWWPDEAPTRRDLDALGTAPLDVLVTHDTLDRLMPQQPFQPPIELAESLRAPRLLIGEAVQRTEPWLMVHGHWHKRLTNRLPGLVVEGLSRDGDHHGNLGVLDPLTRRFESLPVPYSTELDDIIG